jgi:hypothetical protein
VAALRHGLSSSARTLGSRVRILLGHGCVSAFFCVVLSRVDSGLASGWSPVKGVLPNVHRFLNSEKLNSESEQAMSTDPWRRRQEIMWITVRVIWFVRYSWVGIALGYELDDRGSRVRFPAGGWVFFPSPPRPERFWGPPSLLSDGC